MRSIGNRLSHPHPDCIWVYLGIKTGLGSLMFILSPLYIVWAKLADVEDYQFLKAQIKQKCIEILL